MRYSAIKKTKKYYSGKKKKHTLKAQVVADASSKDIICVNVAPGHKHDFRIFKDSKVHFTEKTQVIVDKGYQGIIKIHANSIVPRKASKKHKLTSCEKLYNRLIARCRVHIEAHRKYKQLYQTLSNILRKI